MDNIISRVAAMHGVAPEEVLREIQTAIDAAWATGEPTAQAMQSDLFPDGKPTPEEFIATVANQL